MDKVFYHQALNSPIEPFMYPSAPCTILLATPALCSQGMGKATGRWLWLLCPSGGVASWAHQAHVCPALSLAAAQGSALCHPPAARLLRMPARLVLWPNLLLTPPPQVRLLVVCDSFCLDNPFKELMWAMTRKYLNSWQICFSCKQPQSPNINAIEMKIENKNVCMEAIFLQLKVPAPNQSTGRCRMKPKNQLLPEKGPL